MAQERLDKILVSRGLAASRSRAQTLISSGKVVVSAKIINDPSKQVDSLAEIVLTESDIPWVSRAALKLVRALDHFEVSAKGRVAIDVGSSTGGFSQVLLERGAAKIYAIDVGTDQMHDDLRYDPRIILREGTHFKEVKSTDFEELPTLAVVDVSFISLAHIIPKLRECVTPLADVILLIKPQFEVGKDLIGKGIVRDPKLHEDVCLNIRQVADRSRFDVLDIIDSPIEGADGNKEFLAHLKAKK